MKRKVASFERSADGKIDGATNGSGAPTANQLPECLSDLQMEPPKAEAWTAWGPPINPPVLYQPRDDLSPWVQRQTGRERVCKGALLVSLNSSSEFSSVKNTAKSNNLRKNSIASGYDLQSLDFLGSCQQQVCFFFFLKASYIFFYTCQIETVFVLMGVLINQYVFPLLLCEWLSDECRLCAHPL